jgi:hypothetical protein
LGFIVITIIITMVVIMVVIITVVIIMSSLIPGTGIKLINTIITGTGPRPWPITDLIINMEPDRQIAVPQECRTVHPPIDPQREHLIVRLQEHLIGSQRECPTTVHPQVVLIDHPHQIHPQAGPGAVVEAIVEEEEHREAAAEAEAEDDN